MLNRHVTSSGGAWFLARMELQRLLDVLREDGRRLIGPTVRDGAIVCEEIAEVGDLPQGYVDEQSPGRYRLVRKDDERFFAHVVGPTSWKRYTYPPRVAQATSRSGQDGSVRYEMVPPDVAPTAFLGVRACELAALRVQDRVFLGAPYVETDYQQRRRAALVIAVQCTTSASTCFCTSMECGPEVKPGAGHDLALTEIDDGFVLEAGTPRGSDLLERLPVTAATMEQAVAVVQAVAANRARIGNPLQTAGLRDRLLAQMDHPHWAEVGNRCISCGNCTSVCPTCFCSSVERLTDLAARQATSVRIWDSCFSPGFTKVVGGDARPQTKHRYRQWLTHKFASWWDQFGTSGCTGCGRCITFCPVGIDVREELDAIAPATPKPAPPRFEPVADERQAYVGARIVAKRAETPDTATLVLSGLDPAHTEGRPGQFVMVSLPDQPPAAISVSRYHPPERLELTIRGAGPATKAIIALPVGASVGVRGPLGCGWPVDVAYGKDVIVVTGGTGLAPLRPLLDRLMAERERFGAIRLYYGAPNAQAVLYADELERWDREGAFEVTCRWLTRQRDAPGGGAGRSTVSAIHQASWDGSNAVAYVCGPERMMEATVIALAGRGLERESTWVTLERHMECGLGFCGHCQLGRFFVCRDGPVFRLADLAGLFGREGV